MTKYAVHPTYAAARVNLHTREVFFLEVNGLARQFYEEQKMLWDPTHGISFFCGILCDWESINSSKYYYTDLALARADKFVTDLRAVLVE